MKKIIIPILVVIATGFNAISQEKSRKELKGDKYAFSFTYDKAIDAYSKAKQLTVEGQRKLAESFQKMNQNIQAETTYSKLITAQESIIPEDYYNYAMSLKVNGKQVESNNNMDKFATLKPTDLRARDYTANKENISSLSDDNGNSKLNYLDMNTNDKDFGTAYYKDKIVFASSRTFPGIFKRTYNWSGKPFLNMYVSEVENNQLKEPKIFDKNLKGKFHDGPASFSRNDTYMAFSRNNTKDKSKDKVVELQIYFSSYIDGKWSEAESFILNDKGYSVGHPCLSADGNTMYFASTMPGGFGGVDLYEITRSGNGVWNTPENLGDKINTEGDEIFPFYEETSGTLFFSSNGRYGLGGLDVFICNKNGNGFNSPINAGAPLNSRFDDFAVTADNKMNKGYFSSNRTGDNEDDNIYSIEFLNKTVIEKTIAGVAKDVNGNLVPNTFIELNDNNGKLIESLTTSDNASFTFSVDRDKNYTLKGKKENYTDGSTIVSTFDKEDTIIADVIMLQKEEINLVVKEEKPVANKINVVNSLGEETEFHTIYFDFDKSDIRPDATAHLTEVVKYMNATPSAKLSIGGHCDSHGTPIYNLALSNRRNNSVIRYLKTKGVSSKRIDAKGYGLSKLVNRCKKGIVCTDGENQLNRRVEFSIEESKNKRLVQNTNQ